MASKNSRRSSTFLLIIRLSFANNFMKIYIVLMDLDVNLFMNKEKSIKFNKIPTFKKKYFNIKNLIKFYN